jgi:hypothetical protein
VTSEKNKIKPNLNVLNSTNTSLVSRVELNANEMDIDKFFSENDFHKTIIVKDCHLVYHYAEYETKPRYLNIGLDKNTKPPSYFLNGDSMSDSCL